MKYLCKFIVLIIIIINLVPLAAQGGGRGFGGGGNRANMLKQAEISEKSLTIQVGGRLKPKARIVHQTSTAGIIDSVYIQEGQYVKKDQYLYLIKRDEIGSDYRPISEKSRLNGIVSEILIQENSEVKSGAQAVVIIDVSRYSMESTVTDKDVFSIPVGQKATGKTPDGINVYGYLKYRSQEPDYNTGLFKFTFELPAQKGLHIGQFLVLNIPTASKKGYFLERGAVTNIYGNDYVWKISEDMTLIQQPVNIGQFYGDYIEIKEGIESGDRYLANLTGREKPGISVRQLIGGGQRQSGTQGQAAQRQQTGNQGQNQQSRNSQRPASQAGGQTAVSQQNQQNQTGQQRQTVNQTTGQTARQATGQNQRSGQQPGQGGFANLSEEERAKRKAERQKQREAQGQSGQQQGGTGNLSEEERVKRRAERMKQREAQENSNTNNI